MTLVADRLKMPASLSEYLDSSRNPLNPRNSGNTFYVYGLLPQTLTHLTAVVLTPQKALPPTVRAATPKHWDQCAAWCRTPTSTARVARCCKCC